MISQLYQVKETVKNIAEAIASVLDMDVTIVDFKLRRIAGTGYFKNKDRVPYGSVFDKAIQTGKSFVILNPKENKECFDCSEQEMCQEKAVICCPIILKRQVVGVIGIVTFHEDKKSLFIQRQSNYLNFLDKMANLVAAKISEQEIMENLLNTKKEIETTINTIDLGILSIDDKLRISMCNTKAQELLGLQDEFLTLQNIDFIFPEFEIRNIFTTSGKGYKDKDVSFYRKNKNYHFIVTALPVIVENKCVSVVLILRDYLNLKRSIHKVFQKDKGFFTFDDLLGKDKEFIKVINDAKAAAQTDSNIVITGESGTGKELLARSIHEASRRKSNLFVAVNCAAIPDSLLESELFGYEEGAFTGARKGGKIGMFELSNGGTIFLDEIGDMPLYLQSKLLRVIQERKILRVGAVEMIDLDIRIISATNKNLYELIKLGKFREDLFYRLNVIPLNLPPLRSRKEDILLLADAFIQKYNRISHKNIQGLDHEIENVFLQYHWPGNIRELENIIEYAVTFEKGTHITKETLAHHFSFKEQSWEFRNQSLNELLDEYERKILSKYLDEYGETLEAKEKIAQSLKISKSTLYRKLARLFPTR